MRAHPRSSGPIHPSDVLVFIFVSFHYNVLFCSVFRVCSVCEKVEVIFVFVNPLTRVLPFVPVARALAVSAH